NHLEKDKSDDDELDNCVDEGAVVDRGGPSGLGSGQGLILFAREIDVETRKVDVSKEESDWRHDDVVYERRHDLAKRERHDEADRQVHHVATHEELLEVL